MARQNNGKNMKNNQEISDEQSKLLEYEIHERVEEKLTKRFTKTLSLLTAFLGLLGITGLYSGKTFIEIQRRAIAQQQEDVMNETNKYKEVLEGEERKIMKFKEQVEKAEDDLNTTLRATEKNLDDSVKTMNKSFSKWTGDLGKTKKSLNVLKKEASELKKKYAKLQKCEVEELNKRVTALNALTEKSKDFIYLHNELEKIRKVIHIDEENDFVVIGSESAKTTLEVSEDLKFLGKLDFPDFFGWEWHEEVATVKGEKGTAVIEHSGPGILQFVMAYGGGCEKNNKLVIFIDEEREPWKTYSGDAEEGHTEGWDRIDDHKDDNAGIVFLMPFKKFSKKLRVQIYNAKKKHESSVRVNFLTPQKND